jgi:pilus assembly protein CpaE
VLDVLDKLPTPRPRLIVIGPKEHSGTILRAMRMGVRDYFDSAPSEDDLRSAILRIAAELSPRSATEKPRTHPARVVAVMGAKGGVGATVVACQLAASLRARGSRVALVDLNLPLGDAALYFDVQPAYTIANIARESDRLDATYLRTLLSGKPNGVQILASPVHAEEAELVRGAHVERALNLLRGEFDWVVLDVSRTWSEPTVRALDLADMILLVTLMDVPTLHHTRKHIDLLERLGHGGARIRLIANRHSSVDAVTDKDVADFLERKPDFRIPNDFPTTLAGVNRGVSVADIAPRSAIARAYVELSHTVHSWFGSKPPRSQNRAAARSRAFAASSGDRDGIVGPSAPRGAGDQGTRQAGAARADRARSRAGGRLSGAQVGRHNRLFELIDLSRSARCPRTACARTSRSRRDASSTSSACCSRSRSGSAWSPRSRTRCSASARSSRCSRTRPSPTCS